MTDTTFSKELERFPLPVLLDMWAPWCGPCRTIAPGIDDLAKELAGKVRVAKMNVDENPIVGAQPEAEFLRRLERAAA